MKRTFGGWGFGPKARPGGGGGGGSGGGGGGGGGGGKGKKATPAMAAAVSADNPFEARQNKGLRFSVLGRVVKGAGRNVALSRSKADERRDASLRPVDRRVGEGDASIDAETAMMVRLQKERKRQARVSAKRARFNLEGGGAGEGGDSEELTHFGKSLSEFSAYEAPMGAVEDSEDEAEDAAVAALGRARDGDAPMPAWRGAAQVPAWMAAGGAGGAVPERQRTYKEIMEEVIAKNKAARAARAEDKAAQEFRLQRLDMAMSDVMAALARGEAANAAAAAVASAAAASGVAPVASTAPAKPFAPLPPSARAAAAAAAAATPSAATAGADGRDEFDDLMHTLARQSRAAAATDRTKSEAEMAADEAERLAELEALRLRRMRGDADAPGGASAATGFAPRGASALEVGGDDLGPTITSMLTYRQRKRVEGGASILQYAGADGKKGGSDGSGSESDEESEDGSSDDSDDNASGSEEEDDDDEEGEDEDEEDEEEEDEEAGLEEVEEAVAASRRSRAGGAAAAVVEEADDEEAEGGGKAAGGAGSSEMPYVPACPTSWQQWDAAVTAYCAPARAAAPATAASAAAGRKRGRVAMEAGDTDAVAAAASNVTELLRRIQVCHAIKVKAHNREALMKLYAALVTDLRKSGGRGADDGAGVPSWRLQPVLATLFAMSQEGPLQEPARATWRTVVRELHARVTDAITDGGVGEAPATWGVAARGSPARASACWLSAGEVVLVDAAQRLFPVSDFRHVLLTSLHLTLANQLAFVPIMNETDVARGLVSAALLLDGTTTTRRFAPELVRFLASVLALFAGGVVRTDAGATCTAAGAVAAAAAAPAPAPSFAPLASAAASSGGVIPPLLAAAAAAPDAAATRLPFSISCRALTAGSSREVASGGAADATRDRRQLAYACLMTAATLTDRLVDLLVPPAFLSATRAQRVSYASAAAAPAGDAARVAVHAATGATLSGPTSLWTALPGAPYLAAPDVLAPVLSAASHILAALAAPAARSAPAAGAIARVLTASSARWLAAAAAVTAVRPPLRLHDGSGLPPAIRMLAPLVEDVNAPRAGARGTAEAAGGDADLEAREEIRKLQRAKKRELRGAARELRRDREYLVRASDAVRAKRDAQRDAKYREVMNQLETQQATLKQAVKKGGGLAKAPKSSKSEGGGAGAPPPPPTGRTKADRLAKKTASRAASTTRS